MHRFIGINVRILIFINNIEQTKAHFCVDEFEKLSEKNGHITKKEFNCCNYACIYKWMYSYAIINNNINL